MRLHHHINLICNPNTGVWCYQPNFLDFLVFNQMLLIEVEFLVTVSIKNAVL